MTITPIPPISIQNIQDIAAPKAPSAGSSDSIGQSFSDILSSLSQSEQQSNQLVSQLAAGDNVDVQDVMIGLSTNEINFNVAMSIRDKLVSAYNDVMRMQV